MNLREFIDKRLEEMGKNRSYLVNECDIEWSTLSSINRGAGIRESTREKLALALKCSQGEIQACLAEQNPLKDVVVSNIAKAKMKENRKKKEPEEEPEEELPFDDLPEPEEGEDMKWFKDIPAPEPEEPMTKVKVKVTPELEKVAKENPGTIIKAVEEALEQFRPVEETNIAYDDSVNHPYHYTQGGIECIEAIKASMTEEEFRGFLKGCTIQYMWRYRLKNGLEDLKKASWYLNRLIKELS